MGSINKMSRTVWRVILLNINFNRIWISQKRPSQEEKFLGLKTWTHINMVLRNPNNGLVCLTLQSYVSLWSLYVIFDEFYKDNLSQVYEYTYLIDTSIWLDIFMVRVEQDSTSN